MPKLSTADETAPTDKVDAIYYDLAKRAPSCRFERDETDALVHKIYSMLLAYYNVMPGADDAKEKAIHQTIVWRILNNKECPEACTINSIIDIHFSVHHFMRKWRSGNDASRFSLTELGDLFAIYTHEYDLKRAENWIINKEKQDVDNAEFLALDVKEFADGAKKWIEERQAWDMMI